MAPNWNMAADHMRNDTGKKKKQLKLYTRRGVCVLLRFSPVGKMDGENGIDVLRNCFDWIVWLVRLFFRNSNRMRFAEKVKRGKCVRISLGLFVDGFCFYN